jgi:hypothetical protein
MAIASPVMAGTVVVEDLTYISPENGGTSHNLRLVVPDGQASWQFDWSPDMDGVDIGWRLPQVSWGEDFKVQPRVILMFRDGEDTGLKLQGKVDGRFGWAMTSIRFANGKKTSFYEQAQWDALAGEDATLSVVGVFSGEFADDSRVSSNLGPAITFHFSTKADLQLYYGWSLVARDSDCVWAQLDLYFPSD